MHWCNRNIKPPSCTLVRGISNSWIQLAIGKNWTSWLHSCGADLSCWVTMCAVDVVLFVSMFSKYCFHFYGFVLQVISFVETQVWHDRFCDLTESLTHCCCHRSLRVLPVFLIKPTPGFFFAHLIFIKLGKVVYDNGNGQSDDQYSTNTAAGSYHLKRDGVC